MAGGGRLFNGECRRDEQFFLGVADEIAAIAGVPDSKVQYWQLLQYENHDPLYQEADPKELFRGPYQIAVTIEFDEAEGNYDQESTEEQGVERTYDAVLGVAKLEWERKVVSATAPLSPGFAEPREGDVVGVFDAPDTRWFDVLKVDRSGYVNMTGTFVSWKVQLKNRQSFAPPRRL
jgi:hypothetical protein